MAVDITRQGTKGGDPGYDTSQLRGVREEKGIITGVVKANVHPTSMGVIKFGTQHLALMKMTKHSGAQCVTALLFIVVLITLV